HHADSDVEIDDAKPLEESERSNTQSARVKQYWIDHISGITWIYFALPTFVR
uniref:Uncharacterized protein n=1 Tax=Aegilops tauschii subsp. strangulata TaxID=200361 RepID=A0A453NCB6_AEGTS